jgi:hypothetical protein
MSAEPGSLRDATCRQLTDAWIKGPEAFGPTEMARRLRKLGEEAQSAHQNNMAMRASDVLRTLEGK